MNVYFLYPERSFAVGAVRRFSPFNGPMPLTKLWAVSQCGNVYTLSTDSNQWKLVRGTLHPGGHLRGVKKVAAVRECVWALGCDHLVYVYIPASDVPIRHQVATYENEVRSVMRYNY